MSSTDRLTFPSLLSGTTHVRVGRVLAVMLVAAALQVLTQTVLARALPKGEVGIISLLLGALPLLSTLSLVGQEASTVRFLTREDPRRYDTLRHVKRLLCLVVPLGAAVALLGAGYYALSGIALAALLVLVVSQNAITVVTSILRAAHRYELAMIGTRLPVMATALVLAVLHALGLVSFGAALAVMIAAYAGVSLLLTSRVRRFAPAGPEPVPTSVVREGLFFCFGLSVSFSVMIAVDKLIIAKLLPYSDLAVYATVFAVMRGFDFLFYSLSYVLMPRVNAMRTVSLTRLNVSIAGLACLGALLYLTLGDDVVHVLFAGQYDQGVYLILPFVLSGVLKLFYSVPSSVIVGRLPRTALKQFLSFNVAGMILNVALDIIFILRLGLLGAALATAVAWAVRLAGGYLIVAIHRRHLGPREAAVVEE